MTDTRKLASGQNTPIPSGTLAVSVTGAVDLTALVLSDDGKVGGDADMVFFNQPQAPGAALSGTSLTLTLGSLRPGAAKVVLAASPSADGATFAQVAALTVTMTSGDLVCTFAPEGLTTQTSVVLCEAYQHNGGWKIRAVGQGFNDGLAGLAAEYGVDLGEPAPAPAVAAPAPAISLAKLGKIDLAKSGSATIPIDLSKPGANNTTLTAHLDWDGGSNSRRSKGADLELYALWADRAGKTGVVYYRDLGSLTGAPYVKHAGDSTTPGRETVQITRPDHLAHVAICSYSAVSNGAGSFKSYGAKAVVDDGNGSQITVPLFNDSERYWVCIATISFTVDGAVIRQVEDYGNKTTEDRPLLHPDGRVEMGAGPAEYKNQ